MLQQASRFLISHACLKNAAAVSCLQQQLQGFQALEQHGQHQQQFTQQTRSKSTAAGPLADAADPQNTSSGWSWFGSTAPASPAAVPADAVESTAAALAAAAAPPPAAAGGLAAADIIDQADVLVDVSNAAADAIITAAQASVWWNTQLFMDVLLYTHDSLGMPWVTAIVLSNTLIKLATIPFTFTMQSRAPIMTAMRADTQKIAELAKQLHKAKTAGEYASMAESLQHARAEFDEKYKGKRRYVLTSPALAVLQAVVFISQFNAIATLANAKVPAMTYEGALWFTNLTIPDPYMGLPIICALTTLAQVHTKRFSDAMMQAGPNAQNMKPIMTFMAFMVAVIGWWQPSAMALLWASNSVLAIGQNAILGSPKMREMFGLPPLVQQPAPAASSSSSSSSSGGQTWWQQLFGSSRREAAPPPRSSSSSPAAAVGGPPPPGVAVNYMARKPRRRVKV